MKPRSWWTYRSNWITKMVLRSPPYSASKFEGTGHQFHFFMVVEGTKLMLDESRLKELLALTEELPTVEFKLKYVLSGQGKNKALDELAKDIIALTNTGGRNPGDYAYLVIGAGDTLKYDGTRDHDDVRQYGYDSKMFLTIANVRCSPPIPNLSFLQIEIEGRCYGILAIPPSPHMHSLTRDLDTPKGLWRKSSVLIRHRDEVAVASFEEMTVIKREKERLNATDDRNVTNAGIVDSGSDASQGASLSEDSEIEASRAQVLDTLNSVQSAVEKANENDFRLGTDKLDPFNSVRHHLLSTALMSLQMQSTMLGVHDAQRLYSYRERLEPLQVERMLLFRMLLNDQEASYRGGTGLSGWTKGCCGRVSSISRSGTGMRVFGCGHVRFLPLPASRRPKT